MYFEFEMFSSWCKKAALCHTVLLTQTDHSHLFTGEQLLVFNCFTNIMHHTVKSVGFGRDCPCAIFVSVLLMCSKCTIY